MIKRFNIKILVNKDIIKSKKYKEFYLKYIKNIFILSILSLTSISCQEQNSSQIQTNKIEIGYINLKKEPVKYELELNAKIKPNSLALVRPQISGIIEKQLFVDGSYVEAGDILYKIEKLKLQSSSIHKMRHF